MESPAPCRSEEAAGLGEASPGRWRPPTCKDTDCTSNDRPNLKPVQTTGDPSFLPQPPQICSPGPASCSRALPPLHLGFPGGTERPGNPEPSNLPPSYGPGPRRVLRGVTTSWPLAPGGSWGTAMSRFLGQLQPGERTRGPLSNALPAGVAESSHRPGQWLWGDERRESGPSNGGWGY